ncbi:MAG: tetratricopeptide repeat protein [Muribaculaceae bacterium]|nr:tetratricopeptide repeat protein [Muribaculaceae bacterium]
MMKQFVYNISLVIALSLFSLQASAQSLTEEAEKAYTADNYSEALALYTQAAEQDGVSSDLYYNIGNCYYRMGNNGKAILYYERALNLDPANDNARQNLEFVNNRITDNTNVDETNIIGQMMITIRNSMSANAWATTAIVLFILLLGSIALYVFADAVLLRKIGFFGGIMLLMLTIAANCFAYKSYKRISEKRYAIITVPSVTLSTSPRVPNKNEEAFILNEGTKIYILDSVATKSGETVDVWYDVKADDTHRAWINKSNIDII